MRRYEVAFVLAPTLTEDEVSQSIENFKKTAEEKGAQIVQVDNWGKRRVAFPVKKHAEAHYVILTLEENSGAAVTELERRFKVTDAVIRFLSVRVDLNLKRAEKFKVQRELRKKKRAATPPRKREEEPLMEIPVDVDKE